MRGTLGKSLLFGSALLGLLVGGNARAAITLQDGSTAAATSTSSSVSQSVTVTPGASVLVVNLFDRNNVSTHLSPTYLSWVTPGSTQALVRAISVNNANGTWADSDIYYLFNPAPGTATITARDTSGGAVSAMTLQAFTLAGVDVNTAPATFGINNANINTLSVTCTGVASTSWAVVNSSYGTSGTLAISSTSGTVSAPQVNNNTVQAMGYIANVGASTVTATASGSQKMALAVATFGAAPGASAPPAPTAPMNLVGISGDHKVSLSWVDSSGGWATGYQVWRSTTSGSGYTQIATLTGNGSTSYLDTTGTLGTPYYYVVLATGASGNSGYSAEVTAGAYSAPGAPTLTATAQTNQVALTWVDSDGLATSYIVQRSITSGGPYVTIATLQGNTSTSFIDHSVYDGTAYYYVVQPANPAGPGTASAQASATPFYALPAGATTGVVKLDGGTDSTVTAASGATTISSSFTVSPGAHVLVVELWDNNTSGSSPSSMTWSNATTGTNVQLLTRAVSQPASGSPACNIYYLYNPAPGAGTIAATDPASSGMTMMPFTLRGVETTVAPVIYQNSGTGNASVTLNSVTPANAWAAVLSSGTGSALGQASSSGTSAYKSVNNNCSLGYVSGLAGGSTTISMTGASGASALAVVVFMPAVATPIAILDGGIYPVAKTVSSASTSVSLPMAVSAGARAMVAAIVDWNNDNHQPNVLVWSNTAFGTVQAFSVAAPQAVACCGQSHPNVYYLMDPLPGPGVLLAADTTAGASTYWVLQGYTLTGVDTSLAPAGYNYSNYNYGNSDKTVSVLTAAGTMAGSFAAVNGVVYQWGSGNYMNWSATSGTVATTNVWPGNNATCAMGYISDLPAGSTMLTATGSGSAAPFAINTEVFSPLVLTTVPTAPHNVTATAQPNGVVLSWADSTATSYNVYRSITSGSGYQLIGMTFGATATNFTDTYVVGGTTYYYVIQGANIAGQSPYSAQVSATPTFGPTVGTGIGVLDGSIFTTTTVGTETNFSLPFSVSHGASVLVAATYDNNGNNTAEQGPDLVWSNATFGTTQVLTKAVVGSPGQDNQTWGTLYYLMNPQPGVGAVVATETAANQTVTLLQAYTLSGVDTTVAPRTANIGSIAASTLSVDTDPATLSFSYAAVIAVNYNGGGGNDLTISSTSGTVVANNFRPNGLQCTAGYISNLGTGVSTITANATGVGTSMYLAAEVFSPLITMAAPASVTATGQTNQIRVTWSTVSGATSYVLLRSTTSGHGYSPIVTNSTASYTDTAVTDWIPYYYVVQAYGPNGVSIYSPEATAIAQGLPSQATGLSAIGDVNRVNLSWNSQLGASIYNVWRSTTSGSGFAMVGSTTETNFTDTSVVDGTRYYYQLNVTNSFGIGPNSAQVSAIPVLTFFTNWVGIFRTSADAAGWTAINGSPRIGLLYNSIGYADAPPNGLSTDCLLIETNMGPNASNDLQGMGKVFSSGINVSTYKSLELDIKNFGAYDRNSQIQAVQLNLQVGGTYVRGTTPDIVLRSADTGGTWTHYTLPMTNWGAYDLTQVTALGINVFDSLYLYESDMAVGFANLQFSGAPGWAPTITVANQTAFSGTPSVTLTGRVTALVDSTNLALFAGTPLTVTIGSRTQTTTISDANGGFSLDFDITGLGNGSYPVRYVAASDQASLIGATNTSTTLTISTYTAPNAPTILPTALDSTGANLVTRVATQSGYNYYLLSTPSLTPPVVWTTNSITAGTGGIITNQVPFSKAQRSLFLKYLVQ